MDRETRSWFERIEKWQKEHLEMHKDEAALQRSNRRWIVSGVLIPTAAVLISAISVIIVVVFHP